MCTGALWLWQKHRGGVRKPMPVAALLGRYYLRTRAAADAIKFTVDQEALNAKAKRNAQASAEEKEEPPQEEECLACGA